MRRAARRFSLLIVGASVAGCAASPATPAGGAATPVSSASAQPSASKSAASAVSTPSRNAASSGADTAGPLGVLPLPRQSTPWTDNSPTPMGLGAFIDRFYVSSARADEKRLFVRRGFKSGIIEGWFNADQTQQRIAIARFSSVTGASSAFDDLTNSLREKKAPWKALTDSADGAVGTVDPQLDPAGNAFVDIAARVGDDVIDVHEFSAATPDPVAAKALLAQQVRVLRGNA